MLREILRNIVLSYFPANVSFKINVWKNIHTNYLEAEMPYIVKILKSLKESGVEPVSIDIGANLGLFSYLLSLNSKQVIAIEPQPKLASYLTKVLPKNVSVLNLAISDHEGKAQMLIPKLSRLTGNSAQQDALATIEASNPIMMQKNVDAIEVPTKTLDEILSGQQRIDFIKIDVEGHELAVLNGASITLKKFKPIFMIELYKAHNPLALECFKILFNDGFTCFFCTNSGISECNTLEDVSIIIDNPVLEDRIATNFFFIPLEKRNLILDLFQSGK
jgi:FkbM family methyltransferase